MKYALILFLLFAISGFALDPDYNILDTVYNTENSNALMNTKLPGAMSRDHKVSGEIIYVQYGEAVKFGYVCFVSTDTKFYAADNDVDAEDAFLVLAVDDYSAGSGYALVSGFARDDSWSFTPGDDLYLSGTPGETTNTAPIIPNRIGYSLTGNIIGFRQDKAGDDIIDYGEYLYFLHNGWTALAENDNYRMRVDSNQDWRLEFYSTLMSGAWFPFLYYDESEGDLVFYGGYYPNTPDSKIFFSGTGIFSETDNTMELGTNSIAWEKLWAYDGDFADDVVIDDNCEIKGYLNVVMNDTDVSDPPTDAELDGIWTSPATVGDGFVGYIDDNNDHLDMWIVTSDGTNWWILQMKKAL